MYDLYMEINSGAILSADEIREFEAEDCIIMWNDLVPVHRNFPGTEEYDPAYGEYRPVN